MASQDTEIAFLKQELAKRDQELAKRDQELAKRDQELAKRDQELAEHERNLAELQVKFAALEKMFVKLQRQVEQNSSNSSKPPSSDSPAEKESAAKKRKSKDTKNKKRKRGGQKGHKGHSRVLLQLSEVNKVIELFPAQCSDCGTRFDEVKNDKASRFQVTEIPPIIPHVTEYRDNWVICVCGCKNRASQEELPQTSFGARLSSILVMLSGYYHLSRRQVKVIASDMFGVNISLGSISNIEKRATQAITSGAQEAWQEVNKAKVKHTDGTSWYQSALLISLWTIASKGATVYKIVPNSAKSTIKGLFSNLKGILVSDRASALTFWAMENRQICWAHLIRKFVSFSQRDGPAGRVGRELLDYASLLFQYWHQHKDGNISRTELQKQCAFLRPKFEELLEYAIGLKIEELSGSCKNLLAHKEALWTFVDMSGVEPTNNHAEQELRKLVLWRKRCFGSQSDRGSHFAETMMTVAQTAKKQNVDLLQWLTACFIAAKDNTLAPSLVSNS